MIRRPFLQESVEDLANMSSKPRAQKQDDVVEELMRTHKISFSAQNEEVWLDRFKNTFLAIKQIQSVTMKEFREEHTQSEGFTEPGTQIEDFTNKQASTKDFSEKHTQTWADSMICRARSLQASVQLCLKENRNEAGWRFVVEPVVFQQFMMELSWSVRHQTIFNHC